MTTATLLVPSESMSLSDQIKQLESAISILQNRRAARGVLTPDNEALLQDCIRELAALKRKRGH